jgi:hypothetical protein
MAVVILNPDEAIIGPEDTIGLTLTPAPGTVISAVEWFQTNPIGVITPGSSPNVATFKPSTLGTTGIYAKASISPQ